MHCLLDGKLVLVDCHLDPLPCAISRTIVSIHSYFFSVRIFAAGGFQLRADLRARGYAYVTD